MPRKPPEFVPFEAKVWTFGGERAMAGYLMFAARDLDAAVELVVLRTSLSRGHCAMFRVAEAA